MSQVDATLVFEDLKRLRSGWGLRSGDPARIGRHLRSLLNLGSDEFGLEQVRLLIAENVRLLPEAFRLTAEVGLGLNPAVPHRRLTDRLDWLATQDHVSARTADRNLNRALRALADRMVSVGPQTANDVDPVWHYKLFDASVRLDGKGAEAIERRVVTVTAGSLSEIDTSISIPRHPNDTDPEHSVELVLLHGGRLELREQPFETDFHHVVVLNSPLCEGQTHEYLLLVRLPDGQQLAPHYVYVPHVDCEFFSLNFRFDPHCLPAAIWKVQGVATAVIYERRPGPHVIVPDQFGEVRITFENLKIGRGYGICWADIPDLTLH